MRRGNRASPAFQPSGDSANGFQRASATKHPADSAAVGAFAADLGCRSSAQIARSLLNVDPGELEAICLAREIKAAAVLMDDRAGRSVAIHCGLAVIGTIGLLEQAAARGLLELPQVMERLRQTNARLDPELIRAALERDKALKRARQSGNG